MVERLGEMRKGRRKRIEKRSREKIIEKEKETKRQFEVRDPPFIEFSCSHCFFKSSGYDKLELKHQNFVFTSL